MTKPTQTLRLDSRGEWTPWYPASEYPEPSNEERMFGPERCPDCDEAITPGVLKGANGRPRLIQCRCDEWGGRL